MELNSTIRIFLLCPIPEDQKPLNEYIETKGNPWTKWTMFSSSNYFSELVKQIVFIGLFLGIFFLPPLEKLTFQDCAFVLSLVLLTMNLGFTFLLFRLFALHNRFKASRLFYEEASWFDGQIWEKPFSLIKNDKLIITQKIQPILQRLLRTFSFFLGMNLLTTLITYL